MIKAKERLIVALDVSSIESLTQTVDMIGDAVNFYKIGMESFYSLGSAALDLLSIKQNKVFLDLKLHDIPNTVARSVKVLCRYSPVMTTIHAAGGPSMLKAAVEAAAAGAEQLNLPRPKLLGITVLTSIGEVEWTDIGHQRSIRDSVLRMSLICKQAGMDGVVASPLEAAAVRQVCGEDFLIVTPGVRPRNSAPGDQSRTMAPVEALRAGADFLVVGRPILAAKDPRTAAVEIVNEMEEYNHDRG